MKYEKIKEWLDKLVDNNVEAKQLEEFNNQISTIFADDYIHIYKGIQIIADVMGIELKERKRECKVFPYEYFFEYRGIEFVQIRKEW